MTLGLKFLYGKIEIFDFKKTSFRYVFSIAINVYLWHCMDKVTCIKRMAGVRNWCTKTIMEKKQTEGEGVEG